MAGNILGTLLLNIVTKSNTSGLDKTDRALRKVNRSARTTAGGMGFLGKLSGGIFGGIGFSQISSWFMSYLQFEKNLGSIHSRFYAITKDTKLANEEFEYARRISKETATNLMDVADSYSIFYASASRALGKQGAKEVYENWTKVARVLHVSGEQYKSIMYAQREMSSKGKLYAQDLLIQMGTHVPDVRDLAQKAIQNLGIKGVDTIAKFQKYTEKNPSTDVMGKFMLEMSREAKRRFASDEALKNALKMPDALATRIEIILQDFLIDFSEKGGGVFIVKALKGVTNFLSSINYEKLAAVLGQMMKTVGQIFEFMPVLLHALEKIAAILIFFNTVKFVGGFLKGFNSFGRTKVPFVDRAIWGLLSTNSKASTKIADILLKFTGGKNLVSSFAGVFSSVAGRLTGILGAILLIKDVVYWARNKFIDSKTKEMFQSGQFLNTGFSNEEIKRLMHLANTSGVKSEGQLYDFLVAHGARDVAQYFSYHDNGGVKVYVFKDDFDEQGFGDMMGKVKARTFIKGSSTYFEKPTIVEKFFTKSKVGKQDIWTKLD